jgi:phospholipid-binding lipoprotein MlaA
MRACRTSISRTARKSPFLGTLAISLVLLSGCATTQGDSDAVSYDPLEPMNRKVHSFNMALDKVALRPLAKGYKKVVPSPIRKGVTNFFSNLTTPRSALNNFLQGKPKRGFSELGRFLFNSTLGLGGLFDIAGAGGIERYDENFGQTLSAWGVPDGPYIVLPLWGPNMASDVFALPVDYQTDLWAYYESSSLRSKAWGLRIVDLRYRLLSVDSMLDDSPDPYITVRESYMQNRTFRIYDGDPPEEETYEDELFDEFFEDE